MENMSFPRHSVADLLVHIRNKILTGPEGKNLSKSDLYPNPKVRGCAGDAGCWMRSQVGNLSRDAEEDLSG